MLNPQMKGWGISELYRQQAEQLLAKRKARGEATRNPPKPNGPWLHGMARREEQIELNRGGSCAEVCTHDVLGSLRVHEATTELTLAGGIFGSPIRHSGLSRRAGSSRRTANPIGVAGQTTDEAVIG